MLHLIDWRHAGKPTEIFIILQESIHSVFRKDFGKPGKSLQAEHLLCKPSFMSHLLLQPKACLLSYGIIPTNENGLSLNDDK